MVVWPGRMRRLRNRLWMREGLLRRRPHTPVRDEPLALLERLHRAERRRPVDAVGGQAELLLHGRDGGPVLAARQLAVGHRVLRGLRASGGDRGRRRLLDLRRRRLRELRAATGDGGRLHLLHAVRYALRGGGGPPRRRGPRAPPGG